MVRRQERVFVPTFSLKCELSFSGTCQTKFDAFSNIDDIFDNVTTKFLDIGKIVDNLKISDLSAFDTYLPIFC